jgi:hypothetical protein
MRSVLTFTALLMLGGLRAQGPYSVLLATGDTIVAKEYYTRGDTLGLTGIARAAKKDVLLFWTRKERWTFTHPAGRMVKVREAGTGPCVLGHLCAVRFEEFITPFDSLPVPESWLQDSMLLVCYRDGLAGKGIITEDNGDRIAAPSDMGDGTSGLASKGGVAIGEPSLLIKRSGDTLSLKKEFYCKDSLLCWYGGDCLPANEVLLLKTVKGQFFFPFRKKGKARLDPPVPNMSHQSLGRIYANILFASCREWGDDVIPGNLLTDDRFLGSYRAEVLRLVDEAERRKKRNDTMRIVAGGLRGGMIGAAVTGALIKPEERPFWGTPMPE